jgi:hypothetical protein
VGSASSADSASIASGGATPQCDAARCEAEAKALVASLAAPDASPPRFVGGKCRTFSITGVATGSGCLCDGAGRGSAVIGPKGVGCSAAGRAGDCLWDDTDYEPCDETDDICPELCSELEKRYEADAKVTHDAELRSSGCDMGGYCHWVVRVDDSCIADRSHEQARTHGCSLSDREILEQEQQAQ